MIHPLTGKPPDLLTGPSIRLGGVTGFVGEYGYTRCDRSGQPRMHRGVDWLCDVGHIVYSAHGGTVTRADWEDPVNHRKGYGRRIYLTDGPTLTTLYAHLSELLVKVGEVVIAGFPIGRSGRSGNVGDDEKSHLHFEVWLGKYKTKSVNPMWWLHPGQSRLVYPNLKMTGWTLEEWKRQMSRA